MESLTNFLSNLPYGDIGLRLLAIRSTDSGPRCNSNVQRILERRSDALDQANKEASVSSR